MKIPHVHGVLRRRILVNYRVDPDVLARRLPPAFRPKLQRGHGIAGICLVRLEHVRPPFVPSFLGASSENAAHRVAVTRDEVESAVYVPRRDSDSWLNRVAGGRLFPGVHHPARFDVEDDGDRIRLRMASVDGAVSIELDGRAAPRLPEDSVFGSVAQASRFFEEGSLGYSATDDPERFDGLVLETRGWSVEPLHVTRVASSFFDDPEAFPGGSVAFDHALVMRNVRHAWRTAPDLVDRATLVEDGAAT